jgi:tetratricopeptide (TPR) repeat protein
MLEGVGPSMWRGRDKLALLGVLAKTAEHVGQELEDQPALEAQVRRALGSIYLEIGEYVKAEAMFRECLRLWQLHCDPEHPFVVTSLNKLAEALRRGGDSAGAEATYRKALRAMGREPYSGMSHDALMMWYRYLRMRGDPATFAELEKRAGKEPANEGKEK